MHFLSLFRGDVDEVEVEMYVTNYESQLSGRFFFWELEVIFTYEFSNGLTSTETWETGSIRINEVC